MEGAEINISNNVFKAKADGTQVRHIHIEMAYGSGFDCEGQNIKLTVTDNPVSYTHLDVYKRQTMLCGIIPPRP